MQWLMMELLLLLIVDLAPIFQSIHRVACTFADAYVQKIE